MKTEILYGFHPVWEALSAGRRRVYEVYQVKEKKNERCEPRQGSGPGSGSEKKVAKPQFREFIGLSLQFKF